MRYLFLLIFLTGMFLAGCGSDESSECESYCEAAVIKYDDCIQNMTAAERSDGVQECLGAIEQARVQNGTSPDDQETLCGATEIQISSMNCAEFEAFISN